MFILLTCSKMENKFLMTISLLHVHQNYNQTPSALSIVKHLTSLRLTLTFHKYLCYGNILFSKLYHINNYKGIKAIVSIYPIEVMSNNLKICINYKLSACCPQQEFLWLKNYIQNFKPQHNYLHLNESNGIFLAKYF